MSTMSTMRVSDARVARWLDVVREAAAQVPTDVMWQWVRASPVSAGVSGTAGAGAGSAALDAASSAASSALSSAAAVDQYNLKEMPQWFQQLMRLMHYLNSKDGAAVKNKLLVALVLFSGGAWAFNHFYLAPKARDAARRVAAARAKLGSSVSPSSSSATLNEAGAAEGDAAAGSAGSAGAPRKPAKVAVDAVFFARLRKILGIIIPTYQSPEALLLLILSALLVSRTMFSIYIAELIGRNAQALVARRWGPMFEGIRLFALVTIPASAVNAGLKYVTEILSLRFRVRLSQYVNDQYLSGVNFYKACNLGGAQRIDNADQRVTADIKGFSEEISSLYSSMLKPLLDVILFTYKLASILGWQGPALMHAYFFMSGMIKKRVMPNLGRLVAKESELEGFYRTAHNRIITNSEEIAFYDGSRREKQIINDALLSVADFIAKARMLKAFIAFFDGLLVKYYASIAGYLTLLSPMLFDLPYQRGLKTDDLTRDYIRNSQYLGNLSSAIGQLVIVGNKLTSIAGYTSRVSELLEMVKHLKTAGNEPFEIKPEEVKPAELVASVDNDAWIATWRERCDRLGEARQLIRARSTGATLARSSVSVGGGAATAASGGSVVVGGVAGGGVIELGDDIVFEHVDIVSPEGKLLVKDLNFTVVSGENTMIAGPNGAGKSSLFRILGDLWPLHCGRLVKPPKSSILFVPQKPYLVLGSLRDQVIYPHTRADMQQLGVTDDDLANLLAIVDPAGNILREWQWDTVKDWFHAFSGGQKQRIAMARLFYHRPRFAILDECTSAVSDEVEDTLYQTCRKMGITIFTVSHRVALARHHEKILRFEGNGAWTVMDVDKSKYASALRLVEQP